jgi:hypothetical protein
VSPVKAAVGDATTFTVTGQSLPLTATLSLADGYCLAPSSNTATGFTVVCTPGGVAGVQVMTVRSDTVANGGWWVGTQNITASPATTTPLTVVNLTVDSGINAGQCYAAGSDMLVSCLSPTSIALNDKQDGMVGRDVTSLDNADGQLGLSYSLVAPFAKTECVKDNTTGLTWQGKSTVLTAWPGDARGQDAKDLQTTTNASKLCGFSDWRLPSRGELQSLVYYGSSDLYFAIDTIWFPDTRIGAYYSSTKYAPYLQNVWLVDFTKGSILPDSNASSGVYARLVR